MDRNKSGYWAGAVLAMSGIVATAMAVLFPGNRAAWILVAVVAWCGLIWTIVQFFMARRAERQAQREALSLEGFSVEENRSFREDSLYVRRFALRPLYGISPSSLVVSVDSPVQTVWWRIKGAGRRDDFPWIKEEVPLESARAFELPLSGGPMLDPSVSYVVELRSNVPVGLVRLERSLQERRTSR